jgi:hypothetical protein
MLMPLATINKDVLKIAANTLQPRGKTPISASIMQAAEAKAGPAVQKHLKVTYLLDIQKNTKLVTTRIGKRNRQDHPMKPKKLGIGTFMFLAMA